MMPKVLPDGASIVMLMPVSLHYCVNKAAENSSQHAHLGSWSWDPKSDTVFWSPALFQLFGMEPSDKAPDWNAHRELYTPQSFAKLELAVNECLGKGESYVIELEGIHRSGRILHFEAHGAAQRDEKGVITGLTGLIIDRTRQSEAEQEVRRKGFFLKSILESSLGVVYFSLDTEYRYMEFSKGHFDMMKEIWGVEIATGMNMLEIISNPEDRTKAKANFDRALQGENLMLEEEFGDPSLHRFYYEDHYSPLLDEVGRIVGLACFVVDITHRKLAEGRESDQRHLMEQLLNSISDLIFFKDLNSRFILVNQALVRKNGCKDQSEIIGKTDADFYSEEGAEEYLEEERHLMASGEPIVNKIRHQVFWNKSDQWMSITKLPIRDRNGKICGVMGIGRDVTETKEKEVDLRAKTRELEVALEKARVADNAKRLFLATMSHELMAPLHGMIGNASAVLDDVGLKPAIAEKLRMIQVSGENLLRILGDLLDFSMIEGNRIKLRSDVFSLSELGWEVIRMIEPMTKSKSISLEIHLDPKLPAMMAGDEGRIRQVLINLLMNAVKFTPSGLVTLRIREVGKEGENHLIRFAVEDSGPGIPESSREKIFQPFTREDDGMIPEFGGVGLGLSICKALIQEMGGVLRLESGEEKGSLFYFELPLAPAVEDAPPAHLGVLDKSFARRFPLSLLVVEDQPLNLKLMGVILSRLGYEAFHTATNGKEALEIIHREKIGLVFMDLQMPEMDGISAAEQIRALEKSDPVRSRTCIVALTANANAVIREECFRVGMKHYVGKPFTIRSIAEAIVLCAQKAGK